MIGGTTRTCCCGCWVALGVLGEIEGWRSVRRRLELVASDACVREVEVDADAEECGVEDDAEDDARDIDDFVTGDSGSRLERDRCSMRNEWEADEDGTELVTREDST